MHGEKLQKIRKNLKLSQEEISAQVGISYRAYTSYERGDRKPSFEFLKKLVEEFNVNLNWLLADTGEMFNSTPLNIEEQMEQTKKEIIDEVKQMLKNEGVMK